MKKSIKSLLEGLERKELLTFAMLREEAVKLLNNSITFNRQRSSNKIHQVIVFTYTGVTQINADLKSYV